MAGASQAGILCPKCGHAREALASAPDWQCPACGIAYHKYAGYLERTKAALVPPAAGAPRPSTSWDGSVWALLGANLLALAIAVAADWSAVSMMLLYWGQSVVIGLFNAARIASLDRFSTDNFQINGRDVEPTAGVRLQVTLFFLMHYGIFHAVYLLFLVMDGSGGAHLDGWFLVCIVIFAFNHAWSYRYNLALDRQGTPNIGTLMFTPYVRIIPMHFTIIFGSIAFDSQGTLILFGLLKTGADVAMHATEHRLLQTTTAIDAR